VAPPHRCKGVALPSAASWGCRPRRSRQARGGGTIKYSGDSGIHRRDLLKIRRVAAAGGGLVALGAATAGPAAATVTPVPAPPPTVEAPAPVPTDGAASEPVLSVTKSALGLSDVDNTSDLQKPVSLAQQAALEDFKSSTMTTTCPFKLILS
jgi:hypothetical protein